MNLLAGFGSKAVGATLACALAAASSYALGARSDRYTDPIAGPTKSATKELVAVFVGSATCQFSQSPQVAADWQRVVSVLRDRAAHEGAGFRAIGVGVSSSVNKGLTLLSKIGGFHEISVGSGWASLGIERYVADDHPGSDATPQILILRRSLDRDLGVSDEVLIKRITGAEAIGRWVDGGASFPTEYLHTSPSKANNQ